MAATPVGVAGDWITDPTTAAGAWADGLDPDVLDALNRTVSNVMWVLSGWHWAGVETRTVRPDPGRGECFDPITQAWLALPSPPGGSGHTPGWPRDRLRLPGPIATVTSVTVDGETLGAGDVVVQGPSVLLRVDGGVWPQTQALDRDPGDAPAAGDVGHAWEVVYEQGDPPPPDGVQAAAVLLRELARAAGSEDCRLPWAGAAVTSARRGETISWTDLGKMLVAGDVGVPEVTLWLTIARGGRPPLSRRPRVQTARPRPSHAIWR